MKLLIKKNKVSDFCIYLNNEVTVVDGVLTIGEKSYSHNENESVFSENGVLYEYLDSSIFVFDGNSFVKKNVSGVSHIFLILEVGLKEIEMRIFSMQNILRMMKKNSVCRFQQKCYWTADGAVKMFSF